MHGYAAQTVPSCNPFFADTLRRVSYHLRKRKKRRRRRTRRMKM
jgi:hypothetical protein